MKRKNLTRNALFTSIISLLLCVSMLVGTTFAWFTDSVASGVNNIAAGNLDVEVTYTVDGENWADLDGATDLFPANDLWEPGFTRVAALKIENKGNLALKYVANMEIFEETNGVNKFGNEFDLSDYLTVSTLVQAANDVGEIAMMLAYTGENSVGYETTAAFKSANVLRAEQELFAGDAHYLIIKVDMPETVGNEANHNGTAPSINFGINVLATQFTYESDTFGNQYDKDAHYPDAVAKVGDTVYKTLAEAFAAANSGDTIKLLDNASTDTAVVVDKSVVLNLNGFTVKASEKDTIGDGVFHVVSGGDLTINGEGTINGLGGSEYAMAIWADGGKVTINGGYYTNVGATDNSGTTQMDLIYAKNGGEVVINGGTFKCATPNYTLNCHAIKPGTIIVKGGTFVGFDPSSSFDDGPYIADGYKVVSETQSNGDIWYTVVAA